MGKTVYTYGCVEEMNLYLNSLQRRIDIPVYTSPQVSVKT